MINGGVNTRVNGQRDSLATNLPFTPNVASGYLPDTAPSRMPSEGAVNHEVGQNQKNLPGCLPETPPFPSGYLPGCGVFETLQKLNFLTNILFTGIAFKNSQSGF